jgi:hypothetical protein
MSPDLQSVSAILKIRAQHACVPSARRDGAWASASLEERGDRRRPRCELLLADYPSNCKSRREPRGWSPLADGVTSALSSATTGVERRTLIARRFEFTLLSVGVL